MHLSLIGFDKSLSHGRRSRGGGEAAAVHCASQASPEGSSSRVKVSGFRVVSLKL